MGKYGEPVYIVLSRWELPNEEPLPPDLVRMHRAHRTSLAVLWLYKRWNATFEDCRVSLRIRAELPQQLILAAEFRNRQARQFS